MIDLLVTRIQRLCDQLEGATAEQVADLMRREKVVIHGEENLSDDRPIIGSKFLIQDTIRTKTSPDGHFESYYLTAYPYLEGVTRKWRVQKGRPSDGLV
jgi:hypothetical protein